MNFCLNFRRVMMPVAFLLGYSFGLPSEGFAQGTKDINDTDLYHIPFKSAGSIKAPILFLVVHGDAPFNNPSYQYGIAKKIASENDNVVAVGVLRPGYTDNEGNKSPGIRGDATGDNYTKEVLVAIHQLAMKFKKQYDPSKVVLVGHSGGAAISANLIKLYADFYSEALLISCPCDLHQWRQHMKKLQPDAQIWHREVTSLSPIEAVENIPKATNIFVVHGVSDTIVPIVIAEKYVAKLSQNKKHVKFLKLEDLGHEIAFNPGVFEYIKTLTE